MNDFRFWLHARVDAYRLLKSAGLVSLFYQERYGGTVFGTRGDHKTSSKPVCVVDHFGNIFPV